MRDNMLIYRSFFEAIKDLPAEDQAEVWNAIFELGLNGKLVDLKGIPNTVFKLIRPQIEANIKRFQNGKIPKNKQNKSESEANQEQNKSETESNKNNNININKNDNILIRKNKFYESLKPFLSEYNPAMLRDFFDYWSEHGENDKKMRFEKEKSFGISRRLSTWSKNQKDSGNKNQSTSDDKLLNYVKNQLNN
jgi:hypothetical protein